MKAVGQGQTKREIEHTKKRPHGHAEGTSIRTHELNQNQVSEMIMDSDSYECQCNVAATEEKEYCEEVSMEPHLRLQY